MVLPSDRRADSLRLVSGAVGEHEAAEDGDHVVVSDLVDRMEHPKRRPCSSTASLAPAL